MTRRNERTIFVIILLVGVSLAAALAITAFKQNMMYYFSPSEIKIEEVSNGQIFRLGGMVKINSLKKEKDSLDVEFIVTDYKEEMKVTYNGMLPDLFRENQGIIAKGRLAEGVFVASEVLAKHDENYMPPEVAKSLNMNKPKTDEQLK